EKLVDLPRGPRFEPDRAHPLIATLHQAFSSHRPVCLSPDVIWLALAQGLAHHLHAGEGHRFVPHDQLRIEVRRDDLVKGAAATPWPEGFAELGPAVRGHVGAAHELPVADFSTPGPAERAASEVVLLGALQPSVRSELHTQCGIPWITLEGTVEDWEAIV